MPQPIHRGAPDYPRRAALSGVQGCVAVAYDVRPDGLTDNFEVVDSRPQGVFVKEALMAVRDWRYPERSDTVRVTTTIRFHLERGRRDQRPECDTKGRPEVVFVKGTEDSVDRH